jgi:hypothetical protein
LFGLQSLIHQHFIEVVKNFVPSGQKCLFFAAVPALGRSLTVSIDAHEEEHLVARSCYGQVMVSQAAAASQEALSHCLNVGLPPLGDDLTITDIA